MRSSLRPILGAALLILSRAGSGLATVHPAYGGDGMVVSGDAAATDVGVAILEEGGNAFDAAVAVGFALAVTHPLAGNLGGGGFCIAMEPDGSSFVLDFRETAPAAATRDMYLDPGGDVVAGLSSRSHLAIGVPGSVDGLLRLLVDHGTLPRERVLAPAIALAREGHPVSPFLHFALLAKRGILERYPETRSRFFPRGEALPLGAILVQEDLARTLEAIAREGRDGFYRGRVADSLLAEVGRHGGILTAADLRAYRSRYRAPFVFRAAGLEFLTPPLPSSGGIVLAQILGLVDPAALRRAGWHSAEYVRRITEAARLAYADRSLYLGDPDFVDVPVDRLVSREYLRERARRIPVRGAGRSDAVGPGDVGGSATASGSGSGPGDETTHFCVVDGSGNVVAVTTTINSWFGMGALVPGAGFFLNNEMDDFAAKPGAPNLYGLLGAEANSIAPGKRMLSSMTPAIVRRDGEFLLTAGSPGGSTIITTVLQVVLDVALFDMNIREAIDAPRFHHQWLPDRIDHEPRALSPDTRAILHAMGYELEERESIGRAMGILRTADGTLTGWADRRSTGKAAGP